MTLDEAIKHCLEEAEENDNCADKCEAVYGEDNGIIEACRECAAEHRQLAEWLRELKEAKRLLKAAVEDIHKTYHHRDECCDICNNKQTCTINCAFVWQQEAEALKLIGGVDDV